VSNVQGNKDVIINNQDGLVVNLSEENALANSIKNLIKDPLNLRNFGNSAIKKVESEYSQLKQLSKMADLLINKGSS
jgi:glycosyltransferase involved in cell wall biosynthesis